MAVFTSFQRIALLAKLDRDNQDTRLVSTVQRLQRFLSDQGIRVQCDPQAAALLPDVEATPVADLAAQNDLAIVVGGDGTLLQSANKVCPCWYTVVRCQSGAAGFFGGCFTG